LEIVEPLDLFRENFEATNIKDLKEAKNES
jgi:hypothetical protein